MSRPPQDFDKIKIIVNELKKRSLSIGECIKVAGLENTPKGRSRLNCFLIYIGNHYPLYQPDKSLYKILTDQDLEDYRTKLRMEKKNARAKMG